MASQVEIYNAALLDLGEKSLTTTTTPAGNTADACADAYATCLDKAIQMGPEQGWRFARFRINVDIGYTDITAFADYSGTQSGTVSVTSASHGLVSGELCTITDTSNYDDDYEITKIDANTFYVTATWVSDDATGKVYWTSEEYNYRYAIPSCNKVVSVQVGGCELTDWVRNGQYLLTNQESSDVDIVYVQLGSALTVTNFPPHFVDVLSKLMASKMAYRLTNSRQLEADLKTELQTIVLPRAINLDAREMYVQEQSSSWTDIGRSTTTIE